MATLVAERMRLLAANISDEGRGEYFRLRSSDRAKAGVPEAAQRAVEELVYEEALSHLHPTTIGRPVAVCDACAMVRARGDKRVSETRKSRGGSNHYTGAHFWPPRVWSVFALPLLFRRRLVTLLIAFYTHTKIRAL